MKRRFSGKCADKYFGESCGCDVHYIRWIFVRYISDSYQQQQPLTGFSSVEINWVQTASHTQHVWWGRSLSGDFKNQCHAQNADTVLAGVKMLNGGSVPFEVTTLPKTFKGFISPTPKVRQRMGICCLNKAMNNFSAVHAIVVKISSIGAAWRNTIQKLQRNHQNFVLKVTFLEKRS